MQHSSGKLGSYKALLIGINNYKDPKIPQLETAVNDARAMDTLLREQFGFKTTLLLNKQAGRAAIYKALRGLATDSGPGDSVLIYYAGHGELDRVLDGGAGGFPRMLPWTTRPPIWIIPWYARSWPPCGPAMSC